MNDAAAMLRNVRERVSEGMNFLKLFLQGVALLPSLIQGIESLYGAKTGAEKKQAALEIVGASIKMTDAIAAKTILNADGFTSGLGLVIDGVVACLNASLWLSS